MTANTIGVNAKMKGLVRNLVTNLVDVIVVGSGWNFY